MPSLIEIVVEEAKSRGLQVERISAPSRKDVLDKRLLLIEKKRCQVIPVREEVNEKRRPDESKGGRKNNGHYSEPLDHARLLLGWFCQDSLVLQGSGRNLSHFDRRPV